MVAWSNLLLVLVRFHLTCLVIHLACLLNCITFWRMDIERLAGVVLDAFSVTFKFICDVDSFHDLAQKGVIYRKENKDTTLKVTNICKSYLLKIPFLQCKFVEVVTKNARFTKFLKGKKVSSLKDLWCSFSVYRLNVCCNEVLHRNKDLYSFGIFPLIVSIRLFNICKLLWCNTMFFFFFFFFLQGKEKVNYFLPKFTLFSSYSETCCKEIC